MKKLLSCFSIFLLQMMFAQDYVSVANGGLQYRGNEYRFIGTNYWYGPNLPLLKDDSRGIDRLKRELDDLKKLNINNLRVVVGVEGEGKINGNLRVEPVYMSSPNTFHDEVLNGLDVFMDEVAKRDMTVCLLKPFFLLKKSAHRICFKSAQAKHRFSLAEKAKTFRMRGTQRHLLKVMLTIPFVRMTMMTQKP